MLGGGAGISLSGAYRVPGYSLGAVYEVTFHDSHAIYQRGSLQQARGEWRLRPHFALIGESIAGFVSVGAGIAAYGDNWALSTLGPSAHVAIGVEVELGVKLNLVVSFAYRGVYFRDFTDASGQLRLAGVTQLLGFQLGLELNEPL